MQMTQIKRDQIGFLDLRHPRHLRSIFVSDIDVNRPE